MNEGTAFCSASGSAERRVVHGAGVRSFRHLHQQLAAAILLATFGCLPARCQDAGNFAIRHVAQAPSSGLNRNVRFLPTSELSSGPTFADPQSSRSRSSDGAFKKVLGRFRKDQAEIYSAPFHRSNLKWDALFLAPHRQASRALPGNHLNLSRDISSMGLYATSAAAGILWLSGMATHIDHGRETGVLSAEALATT